MGIPLRYNRSRLFGSHSFGDILMSISEVDIFGPRLEAARKLVDSSLENYLETDSGCPETLRQAMLYSLMSNGKRLRPVLVLAAADVCGGNIEQAMPAACAVEMIHTYSLIHDDLPAMDDDDLRRGQPSCHVKFDEATAILAGDALIPLAFEILSKDIQPESNAIQCIRELSSAAGACNLVGGQSDDLRLQNEEIDLSMLEAIHRRKTGALFTASLRMGCICAGGTDQQLESLTTYGENLGLAFQVTDDLLDLFGEEAKIGKRVGKDTALGKRTYPDLIGVDASRKLAVELRDQAIESMKSFGESAKDMIRFANFVVERNF